MTEEEWMNADDSHIWSLLFFVKEKSGRKVRLLRIGACRQSFPYLDTEIRHALEIAESYADGLIPDVAFEQRVNEAAAQATAALDAYRNADGELFVQYALSESVGIEGSSDRLSYLGDLRSCADRQHEKACSICTSLGRLRSGEEEYDFEDVPEASCIALIRCIFGNPFRPITIDPRWLTSTVLDLAEAIYQERAFDRMPILADALMDAGCDSDEIIAHCRGPGPHVRGCWVVDLLLGKE